MHSLPFKGVGSLHNLTQITQSANINYNDKVITRIGTI